MDEMSIYKLINTKMKESYLMYPIKIEISLTNNCNQNCVHCSKKYLNGINEFPLQSVSDLMKIKPLFVVLSGGEPTMHSQIFDIVKTVKSNGVAIKMLTNGLKFTDSFVKELLNSGINSDDIIQVSLDGIDKNIYYSQRRTDNNQTLAGINNIIKNKINIDIHTVPTIYNINDIINIYEYASSINANYFSSAPLAYLGKANEKIAVNPKQLYALEKEIIKKSQYSNTQYLGGLAGEKCSYAFLLNNNEIKKEKRKKYFCSAGRSTCFINETGEVYPCVYMEYDEFSLGNIKTQSMISIWENKKLTQLREGITYDNSPCSSCDYFGFCNGGCIGVGYKYAGELIPGSDRRCYKYACLK